VNNIDRLQIGQEAETRAVQFLASAGLAILLRNYRCRMGELDIVARDGAVLVIAEVRLRSRSDYGGAAASITLTKRQRIVRTARHLLARNASMARMPARFDVVLVPPAGAGEIEWIRAAFAVGGGR